MYGEVIGSMTAVCERHPERGEFTVSISLSIRGRKHIDCPICGRGYFKLETDEDLELYVGQKGASLGSWYCDRPLTVLKEVLI